MTQTPSEAAIAALHRMELPILCDERGNLVTVFSLSLSELVLIRIACDDQADEALINAELCAVPKARRAKVALLLAELNTKRKYIVFSMDQNVWIDISIELAFVSDRERLIALSVMRLLKAIQEDRPRILRAVQARTRRSLSRAELEVAKLLADLPLGNPAAPDAEA